MPVKKVLAALVVCGSSPVCGQICGGDPPELYNARFVIDQNVTGNRHVDRAMVANSVDGDLIIEFMATRLDASGARERWTVTYECDGGTGTIEHVSIDGQWRYSMRSARAGDSRSLTLSVPGATASFQTVCEVAPDMPLFMAITAQTAMERTVVQEVLDAIPDQFQPPDQSSGSYETCVASCGPAPLSCPPVGPTQDSYCDCMNEYNCCADNAEWTKCRKYCHCDHNLPDYYLQQECRAYWDMVTWRALGRCWRRLVDCFNEA